MGYSNKVIDNGCRQRLYSVQLLVYAIGLMQGDAGARSRALVDFSKTFVQLLMQVSECRDKVPCQHFAHFCLRPDIHSALIFRRALSGESCQGKPVINANVASGHLTELTSVTPE